MEAIGLRPHRAVIWIHAEVHPLDEHGQCAATSIHKIQPLTLAFDGEDRSIAIRRLEDLLEELKGRFKL